jgi:hypothetical protein
MSDIDKVEAEFEAIERAERAERSARRQVWEQQVGESPKAWNAFRIYRDLMEKRTLAKVAETLGCSSTNVERWARRWAWTQRTYEFDLVQEERFREQTIRDRLAHHRRQIQIGQALQSVAVAGLRELQARLEQKLPLNLDPSEIAAFQKLGDDLETRGLGEDREGNGGKFTRIVVNICDAEPIPDEEQLVETVDGAFDPSKLN